MLSGTIKGYKSIWFLGDDFASRTFEQYFKAKEWKGMNYVQQNFEVYSTFSSKHTSTDNNAVSRLCNLLVKAIQDNIILPKFIVIVLVDDLVNFIGINHQNTEAGQSISRILNNIMSEQQKLILAQKDYLSTKAKKDNFPLIIWMQSPTHQEFPNNDDRKLFNSCLTDVVKFFLNTCTLEMCKCWDQDNLNYYVGNYNRFTTDGLTTYWNSITYTVKFANTLLWKYYENKQWLTSSAPTWQSRKFDQHGTRNTDRYHWVKRDSCESPPAKTRHLPQVQLLTPPGYNKCQRKF